MLPKELKKPIDDINSPSNKILIVCLILAIMYVAGLYFFKIRKNDDDCAQMKVKYDQIIAMKDRTTDSLYNVISNMKDVDMVRMRVKIEWQDSVKLILENEIKNEIKKKMK